MFPNLNVVPGVVGVEFKPDERNSFEVLTLRDIFAMNALASLHASTGEYAGKAEQIANMAYQIADAMMAEKYKVIDAAKEIQ